MKKWLNHFRTVFILSLLLILAACSGQNNEAEPGNSTASPSPSPVSTPDNASPSASALPSESAESTPRPDTQSFDLLTQDGYTPHEGKLQHGAGYSLYVFDGFLFDAATGRLSLESDPSYNVTIEQLPSDYDVESLRKQGIEELAEFGEAQEFSGELVEHPLGYSELYLQATGDKGIRDYILWQSRTEESYLFRISNPKGEEAVQFSQPVQISLSTVEADPS